MCVTFTILKVALHATIIYVTIASIIDSFPIIEVALLLLSFPRDFKL